MMAVRKYKRNFLITTYSLELKYFWTTVIPTKNGPGGPFNSKL
jgi:hypothetical protein